MYIEIEKDLIPYRFDIELVDELFTFEINYNNSFDFFTVNVEKDGEVLVIGEKLMLNKTLFSSLTDGRLPKGYLIPLNDGGDDERITFDNLGQTVFVFVGESA